MEVLWRNYLVADVDAPSSALKSSGYEVHETLVGSLFHSLSVRGNNNGKGMGGLPSHDEKLG